MSKVTNILDVIVMSCVMLYIPALLVVVAVFARFPELGRLLQKQIVPKDPFARSLIHHQAMANLTKRPL